MKTTIKQRIKPMTSHMRYAVSEFLKENMEYNFQSRMVWAKDDKFYHQAVIGVQDTLMEETASFRFVERYDRVDVERLSPRPHFVGSYFKSENTRKDAIKWA
ncbi:hypothetical protein [Rossellomorea marisflavi]|uniref:hypothetical protein n=1 Tax=Rossellomorea marisflavi TaxID=189381 RepID=UPI0009A8A48A|nr:hypothetical protein [Rossellomorea marisflavi]